MALNETLSSSSFIKSHMITKSSSGSKFNSTEASFTILNLGTKTWPRKEWGQASHETAKGGSKVLMTEIDVHINVRVCYSHIIAVLMKSLFVGDSCVFFKTLPVIDPMRVVTISKH